METSELHRRYEYVDGVLRWRQPPARRPNISPGDMVGCVSERGYVRTLVNGRDALVHRLIWQMLRGTPPKYIDHINGDKSDNRIENLRAATGSQNAANRRVVLGEVRFRGVGRFRTTDFRVYLCRQYIGRFKTAEEAARAYDRAAVARFGAFACTNELLGLLGAAT